MNVASTWWKDRSGRGTPRVWWLSIFRRQVRLSERPAGRLPVPAVNLSPPQRLVLLDDSSLSVLPQLTGVLPLASARNLTVDLGPSANAENGSVNLIGVLLNKEPTPRLALPRQSVTSHHAFAELRPPPGAQIPLWKRLAYLLQPPTDLLLAEPRPLEWPGTLLACQLEGMHALVAHPALPLAHALGLGETLPASAPLR